MVFWLIARYMERETLYREELRLTEASRLYSELVGNPALSGD